MRIRPCAAGVVTLILTGAGVASADEPEPVPPPAVAARPPRSTAVPAMLIGGGVFALGYGLDLAALRSCRFDCAGTGKLAIPVVGYPLYLADDARRAEAKRAAAKDREARARFDGCENSALGCDTSDTLHDIGLVLAWIPPLLQAAGAVVFVYGAVTAVREVTGRRKPARPPVATWHPTTSSVPGGATLGVLGTF